MNVTASMAFRLVPDSLRTQPVFLCVDDTIVPKSGTKFEDVSLLFDHAAHRGSSYLNGHCFVSLMLCVPVWKADKISWLSVPLGYRMWTKQKSKLELAADMIRQVMPECQKQKNVILLCDSWYMKKPLVSIPEEYPNLDMIGNVRADSVLYDLPPERTGRKGRPAGHGKQLSIETDFIFSEEKIDGYFIAVRPVITNLFGSRKVLAYVTAPEPGSGKKSLFFSTVFPEQLQIFCAWQEKAPLNRTGSAWMKYIPLFFYGFRWNIETSYYEQKTFWSLCSYMVRSRSGIERMVNLINIAYCAMKILPYQDKKFSKYKGCSVQEFRFALSEEIRQQIFFAGFVKTVENGIKSQRILRALKQLIYRQGYHL